MDYRLVITPSIVPRQPIRLVTVGTPSFAGWARKEFVYTPLALIFRRARAAKNDSTPPIVLVSRDGGKVIIAPRIEFTIQWAERLRSQSDHRQQLTQRNRKEREGLLPIPHPITARNHLTLFTAGDNEERKESNRTLSLPSMSARYFQTLSGAAVQKDLKQPRKHSSLFAVPRRHGLNPMKVNDQQNRNEWSRILSMHSTVAGHYSSFFMRADTHRELTEIREHLSQSAVLGRARLNLMRIDDQRNRNESPRTPSMHPLVSRSDLMLSRSLVQRDPDTTHEGLSVSTFAGKQYLTLLKLIDQQTIRDRQKTTSVPSDLAKSKLKLVSREIPATRSRESTVLKIPTGNDIHNTEYRKKPTETMPLLRHQRDETAMVPAFAFQHSDQTSPASVGFESKFHRRIHAFEHQSNIYHQSWKVDHEYVTSTTHGATKHLITSSAPRKIAGTNQLGLQRGHKVTEHKMPPKPLHRRFPSGNHGRLLMNPLVTAGQNTYIQATSHARPVTDYGNPPLRTGSQVNHLHPQMRAEHRQPSTGHQRRISPTEIIYRTEKAPSPPSETVPPSPTPAPIETPQIDIDRLSRDVWCQLEKRIRIERERHGRL